MRKILPQGSYFNRFLSLNYSVDECLDDEEAFGLGLIISECVYGIGDPLFNFLDVPFFQELGLQLSIADSGMLLYAETSRDEGTTVVLGNVPWLLERRDGIELALKWLLARSFQNFLKETSEEYKWIYPINIVDESWLLGRFPTLFEEHVAYRESWIVRESLSKYRVLMDELIGLESTLKYQEQLKYLSAICSKSSAFHRHFADKSFVVTTPEFSPLLGLVDSILESAPTLSERNPLRIF